MKAGANANRANDPNQNEDSGEYDDEVDAEQDMIEEEASNHEEMALQRNQNP